MKLKKIIILLLAVSLVAIGAPKAKAGGIGTGAAIGLGVGALFLGYSMGAAQRAQSQGCYYPPQPRGWEQRPVFVGYNRYFDPRCGWVTITITELRWFPVY